MRTAAAGRHDAAACDRPRLPCCGSSRSRRSVQLRAWPLAACAICSSSKNDSRLDETRVAAHRVAAGPAVGVASQLSSISRCIAGTVRSRGVGRRPAPKLRRKCVHRIAGTSAGGVLLASLSVSLLEFDGEFTAEVTHPRVLVCSPLRGPPRPLRRRRRSDRSGRPSNRRASPIAGRVLGRT